MVNIIDRTTQPSLHWPGIRAIFGSGYREVPTVYDKIFSIRSSSKAHEEDVETYDLGLAQVQAELAPVVFDKVGEGIKVRYRHVAYGLAFGVSREESDDNLYPQVGARRVRSLNYSMRQTKEIVCHLPLNLAFDATLGLRPDGVPLISYNHPTPSGPQSNMIVTPADVSELAIESLVTQIAYAKNRRGLRANIGIRQAIITPDQEFEMHRILGSVLQSNTQLNNVNVLRSRSVIPAVVSTPYLDNPDAWFLQTDVVEGLTVFNRTSDVEIEEDSSFTTGAKLVKAYMRFSAGASDWIGIYGSPGA